MQKSLVEDAEGDGPADSHQDELVARDLDPQIMEVQHRIEMVTCQALDKIWVQSFHCTPWFKVNDCLYI